MLTLAIFVVLIVLALFSVGALDRTPKESQP